MNKYDEEYEFRIQMDDYAKEVENAILAFQIAFPDLARKNGALAFIVDHQNEPHLIATDSDEADLLIDMWEAGRE